MQSVQQGHTYVQNATGIWTPVGTATGAMAMPAQLTSPNAAGAFQFLNPYGTARVSTEPVPQMFDPFDASIDTNRWTTSGTVPPTISAGSAVLAPSTTASASSVMSSVPLFASPGAGFATFFSVVTLEAAQVGGVNSHRFWGKGAVTSYAYATPVTNGFGFEVDGTGALNCVLYVAGTRYVINSTSAALVSSSISLAGAAGAALPAGASGSAYGAALTWQGNTHRYIVLHRSDASYWYVDGMERPVASVQYLPPQVQTLPVRVAQVNNSAGTLASTFTVQAIGVSDNTASTFSIHDGTYNWREAQVDAAGALRVRDTKEATRTSMVYSTVAVTGVAAETVLTSQLARGATVTTAQTTLAITAGKALRINALIFTQVGNATTATLATTTFRLRVNTAGAAVATSTLIGQWRLGTPATINAFNQLVVDIPDGLDIANTTGTTNLTLTQASAFTTNAPTVDATLIGYEY